MKEINNQEEVILTPQQAGEFIGCSAYTIKELARRNKIPFYKAGSKYMFRRSTLLKWIEDQEKNNYIR